MLLFSLNSFGLTAVESVVEVMQVSATLGSERETNNFPWTIGLVIIYESH